MSSTGKNKLFFSCFFLLTAAVSQAQLVDLTRTPPYRPVFAAFNSSYLTQLEIAYVQDLPNTLKLSIGMIWLITGIPVTWIKHINNGLVFRLSDNGIGKQHNTSPKGTGFGTELVNLLVQQLEGKLTADSSNGTTITIHFKNRKPH